MDKTTAVFPGGHDERKVPGEELIFGRSYLKSTVLRKGSILYMSFTAEMVDIFGEHQGSYEGVLIPLGDGLNIDHLLASPPMPGLPIDSPKDVPEILPYGKEKLAFNIRGKGSLLVPGLGFGRVVALREGGALMMIEFAGEIADGTVVYAGARGIASGVGFALLGDMGIEEGMSFDFRVFHSLRVIRGDALKENHAPSPVDIHADEYDAANEAMKEITDIILFSTPVGDEGAASANQQFGIDVDQTVFSYEFQSKGVQSLVGRPMGRLRMKFRNIPADFRAAPGHEPPATPFSTAGRQRFVVEGFSLTVGGSGDSVRAFGTGQAFAGSTANSFHFAAVLDVVLGEGQFAGRPGIVTLNGRFLPTGGVVLLINLRIVAPPQIFAGAMNNAGGVSDKRELQGETIFICSSRSTKGERFVAGRSAVAAQQAADAETLLRLVDTYAGVDNHNDFRATTVETGGIAGDTIGQIIFDPSAMGEPIPLTSLNNTFNFNYPTRRRQVSIPANIVEGRAFRTQMLGPYVPGEVFRIGAIAPVNDGQGPFKNASGIVTSNFFLNYEMGVWSSIYIFFLESNKTVQKAFEKIVRIAEKNKGSV